MMLSSVIPLSAVNRGNAFVLTLWNSYTEPIMSPRIAPYMLAVTAFLHRFAYGLSGSP